MGRRPVHLPWAVTAAGGTTLALALAGCVSPALDDEQYNAKAKLKVPVTCLTCHATNPEEDIASH